MQIDADGIDNIMSFNGLSIANGEEELATHGANDDKTIDATDDNMTKLEPAKNRARPAALT